MIVGGEVTDHDDEGGSGHHAAKAAYGWVEEHKQQGAGKRCNGVNMFDKDVRHHVCHHITEHAAPDTSQHTDKDGQETVAGIPSRDSGAAADDGEDTESDRVAEHHDTVVPQCE